MVYSRQKDPYDLRLAGNLLKACENGTADFLNPAAFPYYTQDIFNNQVLRDAGQLQTLLNNSTHGTQYINYAPTYIFQDTKREMLENDKSNDKNVGCIIYKGKDENGNKHYEMMSPAKRFNPGGINESPMTQTAVPNVGICRQSAGMDPSDPKGIEKYITDVIGNYFNAAFTKTPYFPPQWGALETEMLSKALNADPSIALRTAQQAFAQATSVKMENTVNQELNDNVREAMKQGLPPFNTKKLEAIIGPVNANGVGFPANGVPTNGVDFINSYYNGIKGKNNAANSNAAQNGYIPYQTHNENPKNIDKFLVEEYGNLMNASLTGTPYSGSVTPAQLKSWASGIEAKMAKDPAYMSGIVNQAQQNVVGFNYMPFNKDDFITRAQDPSSREYKLLDQIIASHINDICKNNKPSFNGKFQELSKNLTDKIKTANAAAKTAKTPSTRASSANKDGNTSASASAAGQTKSTSTKASTAKKDTNALAGASAASQAKSTSTKASTAKKDTNAPAAANTASQAKSTSTKASTAKKDTNAPTGASAVSQATTPSTGTSAEKIDVNTSAAASAATQTKTPSTKTSAAKKDVNTSAAASAATQNENPSINPAAEKKEERPSFVKEVSEFVRKNIVEKKPALVMVDTFLGTLVDKAKKIVRTGKTIATAFVIATNVLAPNLQMTAADYLVRMPTPNTVSISVNQNDFKSNTLETVRAGGLARQNQQVKTTARK
jgi:hypothetical protein